MSTMFKELSFQSKQINHNFFLFEVDFNSHLQCGILTSFSCTLVTSKHFVLYIVLFFAVYVIVKLCTA